MKRMMMLLLVLLLVVPITVTAEQENVQLTASAKYDSSSQAIMVSGILSTGEDQWITIQLLDDESNPIYFDQITSGEQGVFSLSIYIPKGAAERIELRLGAVGLAKVKQLSVELTADSDPSPSPNPSPSPSSSPNPSPSPSPGDSEQPIVFNAKSVQEIKEDGSSVSVVQLTEQQLEALLSGAAHSKLIVHSDSKEGNQELRLSLEQLKKFYDNNVLQKLVFQYNGASFEVPLHHMLADAKQVGSDSQAIIIIESLKAEGAGKVTSSTQRLGSISVSDPVVFKLALQSKSNTTRQEITALTGYSEKEIVLGAAAAADRTVAVIYDPITDRFRPVPTVIEYKNGQWVAIVKYSSSGIYTVVQNDRQFEDLAGHWSRDNVELLANRLIINGISETQFSPDSKVSRAQFAAMLVRALSLDTKQQAGTFTDVKSSDWYSSAVHAAAQAGIVSGYDNGEFRPNQSISRQEMTVMLLRASKAAGIDPISPISYEQVASGFNDSDDTLDWAKQAVSEAIQRGWMQGRSQLQLAPEGTATRAESAVLLIRLMLDLQFINS